MSPPIRKENRALYPPEWSAIRERILARAGNHCEFCGVENHAVGFRDGAGVFHRMTRAAVETARLGGATHELDPSGYLRPIFKIVLTVAHLNHDPADNRPENLKALCQKCHNSHDAANRAAGRRARAASAAGQIPIL